MKARYVVDTNVMIAASAVDPVTPADIDATPDDPTLRAEVWRWLDEFRASPSRLVLDFGGEIFGEYCHKLGFNDFGRQVVIEKWSTVAVDDVDLKPNGDSYDVMPATLTDLIHDVADRKMVAAAVAAQVAHGECPIAFAGDTDWHGWEQGLNAHGLILEPIIEAWSSAKYKDKLARSARASL
jgi:hypothetical protein